MTPRQSMMPCPHEPRSPPQGHQKRSVLLTTAEDPVAQSFWNWANGKENSTRGPKSSRAGKGGKSVALPRPPAAAGEGPGGGGAQLFGSSTRMAQRLAKLHVSGSWHYRVQHLWPSCRLILRLPFLCCPQQLPASKRGLARLFSWQALTDGQARHRAAAAPLRRRRPLHVLVSLGEKRGWGAVGGW